MKRHPMMIAAVMGIAMLGGCASRTSRVEAALVKGGVSERMAACLAPRLSERLSNDQLRALAAATKRAPAESGKPGMTEILARVASIGDPDIVDVVSRAGLHCALKR